MVDPDRLQSAYHKVFGDLLDQRSPAGNWVGRTSSSPLATAAAISGLVLSERYGRKSDEQLRLGGVYDSEFDELIYGGLDWLAGHQSTDGGWGDTDRSLSDLASTISVVSAFHLTGVPVRFAGMLDRAEAFVRRGGGARGLRRGSGPDRQLAAMILAHAALAGFSRWREVPWPRRARLCPPTALRGWLGHPLVGYTEAAKVAVGLARLHHARPVISVSRLIRTASIERSLQLLQRVQPSSGGFFESVPLTGYVVMGLASSGRAGHPVCIRGVEFLLESVRADGSWPLDMNRSIANTAMALTALVAEGTAGGRHDRVRQDAVRRGVHEEEEPLPVESITTAFKWLIANQRLQLGPSAEPFPGGWAWTDRPGGVPTTEDTATVLLSIARSCDALESSRDHRVEQAVKLGLGWLLEVQHADGGWPVFCRDMGGKALSGRSPDVTAQSLRALRAWRSRLGSKGAAVWRQEPTPAEGGLADRIDRAIRRGVVYLEDSQQSNGSWRSVRYGDPLDRRRDGSVAGTARVLIALGELGLSNSWSVRRATGWLCDQQQVSGGWGSGYEVAEQGQVGQQATVEETSWVLEALLAGEREPGISTAVEAAITWLIESVELNRHRESAPIGVSIGGPCYYEAISPLAGAVSALGRVVARRAGEPRVVREALRELR
jgi:squalene-hopene/tetraprenyl-beta-curcumene cyclase